MLRYVEGGHDDRFDHERHVNPSIYLASRLHSCFVFVSGIKANQRHIVLRNVGLTSVSVRDSELRSNVNLYLSRLLGDGFSDTSLYRRYRF